MRLNGTTGRVERPVVTAELPNLLNRPAARKQLNDKQNERNDQQNVN
jgi:hypothetical protein